MELPYYIQKAVDLGLLDYQEDQLKVVDSSAINTVLGTARIVEKLQPTTIVDRDDTTDQEAIILCRTLISSSGFARELWSQLRTAFGVAHGQQLPANLWSNAAFRAIAREIDLTFIGERTGKTISKDSLITGFESIAKNGSDVSFSDFCTTISELASHETMKAYGSEETEWSTALDILKQKRVLSLYKETIYLASQTLKTDPKLEKALEFMHTRTMEGIGMLSGSIGNQNQAVDLTESICGDPGPGRLSWADYIINSTTLDKPVSTGIPSFDLDMDGGVAPPRPNMPRAGRLLVVGARTGIGKCLGYNTPVIMADGQVKPVQDILEGDCVLGPDGEPRTVAGLARGQEEMYKISPVKGDPYIVNKSHILSLKVTGVKSAEYKLGNQHYYGGQLVNISVSDYLNLPDKVKHILKGWRPEALSFPMESDLPNGLDAYVFGSWLGDGSTSGTELTLSDKEIIDYILQYAENHNFSIRITPGRNCNTYSLSRNRKNFFLDYLNANKFTELGKHIPLEIKTCSIQNRLDLLAGIIDTDGYLTNNCYEIVCKQYTLAMDIAFVARSLGLGCTVRQVKKGIKSINFTGTYYRLFIFGDTDKIPVKVKRKKAQSRRQIKNPLNTGILVEPIGVDDYYGFELYGPDKLFLLGDFTVTHNTGIGTHVACSLAKGGLTVGVVSAELDSRAMEARIIANLSKALVSPFHWKRLRDENQLGYVTVGELELVGATKAQQRIANIVANVGMRLDEVGGKVLVEAPWGACVDTCINIMRSMKAKQPELRAVVLDHFHALSRHKGGSATNVSAMLEDRAYKLMTAAKELDIDLFVLAQLNRIGMDATSNAEPQLNEIRGTDALAHVSHATWLIRRAKSDDQSTNKDLEVWHSKVRGRQAVWKEGQGVLESIHGFIEKSIVRMHYETASIEDDTTASLIKDLELKYGLKL